MPPDIGSSGGEGVGGEPNGLASPGEVEVGIVGCSSDNAVVGAAFTVPEEPAIAPANTGNRAAENFDPVDIRDERDPGRKGDGTAGRCPIGKEASGIVGDNV